MNIHEAGCFFQVRTLYAFASGDGGELSFDANEILTITRQVGARRLVPK